MSVAPGRCPYCREALEGPTGLVACAGCGARHHAPCWEELRRCAGCQGAEVLVPKGSAAARPPSALPPGSRFTLSHEPGRTLAVSWPFIPPDQVPKTRGCASVLAGIGAVVLAAGIRSAAPGAVLAGLLALGAALLALNWLARYREARCQVRLEADRIRVARPGSRLERLDLDLPRERVTVLRSEGDGVDLREDETRSTHHLVGVHGVGSVLREEEARWLYELLSAWKLRVLELGGPEPAPSEGEAAARERPRGPEKEAAPG